MNRYYIFILLAIVVPYLNFAQGFAAPHIDTLEDNLNITKAHKDGYSFANRILMLPEAIVQKNNGRRARVIGTVSSYTTKKRLVDENGTPIFYQERKDGFLLADSIKTEQNNYWVGTSFGILSIAVWDEGKQQWKLVYQEK